MPERPEGCCAQKVPDPFSASPVVILGDTMGELRKFYALATVVFVGRSLVPMGGSDPMEVAALSKPIIVGPHMENFALPTQVLEAEGALCSVHGVEELVQELSRFIQHADVAHEAAAAGRRAVLANQGATRRTVEALAGLLDADHIQSAKPGAVSDKSDKVV